MVIIGATLSRLAIRIPISAILMVNNKALVGSPDLEPTAKMFKKGMMLSLAIACRRRGALWKRYTIQYG
jgi:hypothetical protein